MVRSPEVGSVRNETDISYDSMMEVERFPRKSKNSDKRTRRTGVPGILNRFISVYSHLTDRFPEQRIWISSLLVAGNRAKLENIFSKRWTFVLMATTENRIREFVLERMKFFSFFFFCLLGRYPWDYILDTKRHVK